MGDSDGRRGLVREFAAFAWSCKLYWMTPIALVLALIGVLVFAGYAKAPFLYTLF